MRRLLVVLIVLASAAALPAQASALWSRARLMSATPAELAFSPTGALGQAMSDPTISADGRYVAFQTRARNLFTGADQDLRATANGGVLRREIDGTALEAVAPGPALTGAPAALEQPSISADGRFVAFASPVALVAEDTDGGLQDVYVRDMNVPRTAAGAYDLVSSGGPDGAWFALPDGGGAMSADARRVLYVDITDERLPAPLMMRDRATRQAMEITPEAAPRTFGGATLSADGSTVAWVDANPRARVDPSQYLAGEIPLGGLPDTAGETNADLLWWRFNQPRPRRVAGSGDSEDPACPPGTTLAPDVPTLGAQPPRYACDGPFSQAGIAEGTFFEAGAFSSLRLSATGSRIAWTSALEYRGGPRDPRIKDLFIRDMTVPGGRKATTRELTRFNGTGAQAATLDISGNAAAVSTPEPTWTLPVPSLISPGLPPVPPNSPVADTYAIDIAAGLAERVSTAVDGGPSAGLGGGPVSSTGPSLSAGGGRIAFRSDATNLLFGDANGIDDIFVADRFRDSTGSLPQEPYAGASGAISGKVFPVWRLSVTVSRGGRVLYVDARVPGAGTLRAVARSRTKKSKRTSRRKARKPKAVAVSTAKLGQAGEKRLRLRLRTKYFRSARRKAGLPVRVTVRFTPRRQPGQRRVTTLERVRTSTYRVTKRKKKSSKSRKTTKKTASSRRRR